MRCECNGLAQNTNVVYGFSFVFHVRVHGIAGTQGDAVAAGGIVHALQGGFLTDDDEGCIRQYEMENFVHNYAAYTALGGNSFIENVREEVCAWEIVT